MVVLRLSRYQTAQLPTIITATFAETEGQGQLDKDEGSRVADQSGIEFARRCNTARYHPGTFDTGRVEDARNERLNIFIIT